MGAGDYRRVGDNARRRGIRLKVNAVVNRYNLQTEKESGYLVKGTPSPTPVAADCPAVTGIFAFPARGLHRNAVLT